MEINFMDELLKEVEAKELEQTEASYDLMLLAIKKFQSEIEHNFQEAEKECTMIRNFILSKNSQIQERIKWLEMKLEAYIRERGDKTISLCNGTLKMHKKPDRVEIEDLELFLKNARKEWLSVIPEQVKPNLLAIKNYIKTRPTPQGVKIIEGQIEFNYSLNKEEENVGEETQIRAGLKSAS
ncbi:MAG TPA: host-nuclease inhibitor Gam family protein [Ignavibacteriaceae bacterium]|nr:host-nuclease inhibitor Gam family protein [Ignavibacteriaceae bacterium]